MKVYAAVRPDLSRSIYRINAAIRAAAPPGVEFVDDPCAADLQILDVIGPDLADYIAVDRHVLIIHCYKAAPPPFWARPCRQAVLTICAQDMSDLAEAEGFEFLLTPFGVDGSVFYDHNLQRDRLVLTTGYSFAEAIWECTDAARRATPHRGPHAVHVGYDFWRDRSVEVHEGVTDAKLATLYSRAKYVSGLRRVEGFELPVLEGLACGARPICFDTPGYRRWFEDHAVFVPELPSAGLTDALVDVLARDPDPVTVAERDAVITRFSWPAVAGRIWRRVLDLC